MSCFYIKVQKSNNLRKDDDFVNDGSTEVALTHSLKLFGKTIVTGAASASSENYQPRPCFETDERSVQLSSLTLVGPSTVTDAEHPQTGLCGGQAAYCYKQIQNEISNTVEVGSSLTSLPYRNFYGGASYPFLQLHNLVTERDHIYSINAKELQVQEVQKNEWVARSNTGSGASADLETQTGCAGDGDRRWDAKTLSGKNESVSRLDFVSKASDEVSAADQSKVKVKCLKGFAPYKRCLGES